MNQLNYDLDGSCLDHLNEIINNYHSIDKTELTDLRHLKTYTIDAINTFEVDDAISLDLSSDQPTIWIHISSPTEYLTFESPLEKLASKRTSTLYLAENNFYMFPYKLIDEVLSLSTDRDSIALSIGINLKESGEIDSTIICRSLIRINFKLTYEDVDEILDLQPKEEVELQELLMLLDVRKQFRVSQGALLLEEPEGYFFLNGENIEHSISYPSQSKRLVSESMILFGSAIATYCYNNNIPIPYRVQEGSIEFNKQQNYSTHINNFLLKNSLPKSTYSMIAKAHCSLGLDFYTQATSPIRRYIDLLTHYQVVNALSNKKLLNSDSLNRRINDYNINTNQVFQRLRINKRILIAKWFYSSKITKWKTVFLRWLNKSDKLALLYFDNLKMDIACFLSESEDLYLGNEIFLEFYPTDLFNNRVDFRLI